MSALPSELRTRRLLMRPWRASDAAALLPILEANQAHLGLWIPARVARPVLIPGLEERLRGFGDEFEADLEWRYGLFSHDGSTTYGEVDVFPRDAASRVPYALADRAELGYWMRADATGRGLATEATGAALAAAAKLSRFRQFEIRCDERNGASAAIP